MTTSYPVPANLGLPTKVSEPAQIAKLKGDPARGKAHAEMLPLTKIEGVGVPFGPGSLIGGRSARWRKSSRRSSIPMPSWPMASRSPSASPPEKPARWRRFLTNYSWHAGSLKLKVMGGQTCKILFRRASKVDYLNDSWMPSASELGLKDQELADLASFLKACGSDASAQRLPGR